MGISLGPSRLRCGSSVDRPIIPRDNQRLLNPRMSLIQAEDADLSLALISPLLREESRHRSDDHAYQLQSP